MVLKPMISLVDDVKHTPDQQRYFERIPDYIRQERGLKKVSHADPLKECESTSFTRPGIGITATANDTAREISALPAVTGRRVEVQLFMIQ